LQYSCLLCRILKLLIVSLPFVKLSTSEGVCMEFFVITIHAHPCLISSKEIVLIVLNT
jgi:hypothetical protein